MVTEVILPKLGQTMEEGTIVEWLKSEGDAVQRGDLLFTTESDKATLEVEAPGKGFLRRVLFRQGETVPVLTVVALITRTADEDISAYDPAAPTAKTAGVVPTLTALVADQTDHDDAIRDELGPEPARVFSSPRARKLAREKDVDLSLVTGTGPNGRISERDVIAFLENRPRVTPVARKTAEALGVDITAVSGSGVGGRVTRADVEAVAQAQTPAPAVPETGYEGVPPLDVVPVSGLRRITGERMAASAHTAAQVTLVTEVDATRIVEAREQLKTNVAEQWGFAPAYNDLLVIIVARALREYPYMNARLTDNGEAIERPARVNIGVAVDTERGLLVPVIRDADHKGLREIGAEFRELMARARAGKALPDDLAGGTFTLTNLGMYDIDAFTPIINLPEAAILGVGRIQAQPVAREGAVVVRQMATLSLSFDHRLVDGAPAARFLQRVKQLVESPYLLLS
jgi:pyruvate dehydrogenase E2 component (dihydrolipoamide acetyltransferase)